MSRAVLHAFWFVLVIAFVVSTVKEIALAAESDPPRLVVSIGHTSRINAVAHSSDDRLIGTGGDDGAVSVRDVATGAEIRRHLTNGAVHYLAFSPDNSAIFAGGGGGAIIVEVSSGRVIASFPGHFLVSHGGFEGAFAFSQRGHRAFTVDSGFDGLVWDVDARQVVLRILSGNDHITAAAFSPDETALLLSRTSGALELVRLSDGHNLWRISDSDPPGAHSIDFSPDGKLVIIGSLKPSVRDAASGQLQRQLIADNLLVLSVALSKTGKYALCGTWGRSAWLWDVRTGMKLLQLTHNEPVSAVAFSNNDETVLTGSWDGTLRFWEIPSGRPLPGLEANINGVHEVGFRGGVPYIVSSSRQNVAFYWDVTTPTIRRFIGHRDSITSAALAPDGERLITASVDLTASIWSLATSQEIVRFGPHEQLVLDAQFTADGRIAVTEASSSRAYIWDALNGDLKARLGESPVSDEFLGLQVSSDGERLASAEGGRHSVIIWNSTTGDRITAIHGEMSTWAYRRHTHDLALARADGTLEIVDSDQGKSLVRFDTHSTAISIIRFSDDGRALITGDAAGTVEVWDSDSGARIQTLQLPSAVSTFAISPNHQTILVTTFPDQLVHVWDLNGIPREIARIATFEDGTWVIVDPDGRFDTNNLTDIRGMAWVLPQRPTVAMPIENFMRQFYEPQLLRRLLTHEHLPPISSLTTVDTSQPALKIERVVADKADRRHVSVEIVTTNARDVGAHDLRLFRDGILVAHHAAEIPSHITLGPVALPNQRPGNKVLFSAYAFNAGNVKSATSKASYALPSDSEHRKPRLYLISIGVSANEHDTWRLSYADNDALLMARALTERLNARADTTVVPVTLTSTTATSANIQAVVSALTGAGYNRQLLRHIPGATELERSLPDDVVVIFFSGHGYTGSDGTFFFVPYDTGTLPISNQSTVSRFVSSNQLSDWLAPLDASSITLIVDACESAEAVQAYGFRPGPFGSRGLGQLAYDKGMRVLAASEAESVALEIGELRHGLLTYALAEDGLYQSRADRNPRNGTITLSKLLRYGTLRVSELHREIQAGFVQAPSESRKGLTLVAPLTASERPRVQQPVLFDFAVDRLDVPLVGYPPVTTLPELSAYAAAGGVIREIVPLPETPDVRREQDEYKVALVTADLSQRIKAFENFLLRYPLTRLQTQARVNILKALIETHSASNEILGTGDSLLMSLRDGSQDALNLRYGVLLAIARAIENDPLSIERARELAWEALRLARRVGADPADEVKELYDRLLERVALKARAEQFSLDDATLEVLGVYKLSRPSASAVVLYGSPYDATGVGTADIFESERVARGEQPSIIWSRYTPPNNRARLYMGEHLKISDIPTILVIDRFGFIRFGNEAYNTDLGSILELQLDLLTREAASADHSH